MREDYYELLDIDAAATPEEVKKAYYRQARRYHPDRNAGDPAAEERFKLVAEAYRVLGDADQRYQYDGWLERHRRLSHLPELESMQRRVRVSARHARERREEQAERRERRRGRSREGAYRPVRPFLLRRGAPPSLGSVVAVYALAACLLVPPVIKGCRAVYGSAAPAEERSGPEPTAEQVQERLARLNAELLQKAQAGDPVAQLRYGFLLYRGVGIGLNREEAREWWKKSAAQGNTTALYCLEHYRATPAPQGE